MHNNVCLFAFNSSLQAPEAISLLFDFFFQSIPLHFEARPGVSVHMHFCLSESTQAHKHDASAGKTNRDTHTSISVEIFTSGRSVLHADVQQRKLWCIEAPMCFGPPSQCEGVKRKPYRILLAQHVECFLQQAFTMQGIFNFGLRLSKDFIRFHCP